MSDFKINELRAKALAKGVKQEDSKSVSQKMREIKPFANIASRPNAQYDNKKQRGYGIK